MLHTIEAQRHYIKVYPTQEAIAFLLGEDNFSLFATDWELTRSYMLLQGKVMIDGRAPQICILGLHSRPAGCRKNYLLGLMYINTDGRCCKKTLLSDD